MLTDTMPEIKHHNRDTTLAFVMLARSPISQYNVIKSFYEPEDGECDVWCNISLALAVL